jgi:hypothetical protein
MPKDKILPFSMSVLGANSKTFDPATDTFLNSWSGVSNSRKAYDRNEVELVGAFKYGRFSVEGQVVAADVDPELKYLQAKNDELRDLDITALGARLQAGLFLIPTRLEIAGRFASVQRESSADFRTVKTIEEEIDQTEYRAGLNWYFSKHDWKWQFDVGQISTEWKVDDHKLAVPVRHDFAGGVGFDDKVIQNNARKDVEFRTQFQIQF